jgi:hypothetical protein
VDAGDGRFVSATCKVENLQHVLMVLPKKTGDAGPDGKVRACVRVCTWGGGG